MRTMCLSVVTMLVVFCCLDAKSVRKSLADENVSIDTYLTAAKHRAEQAIELDEGDYIRLKNRPVLVLEGDSWFDLPWLRKDISDALEDKGYAVMSGAQRGDSLENMAFNGQLAEMASQFRNLARHKKRPKAILLSAGGNDIVGPNMAFILNHNFSSISGGVSSMDSAWMDDILSGALRRFKSYVIEYIATISRMCYTFYENQDFTYDDTELAELLEGVRNSDYGCKDIPIIIHGYDYPSASGEGFKILWLFTAKGPWLKPAFDMKQYSEKEANSIIRQLLNRYNSALREAVDTLQKAYPSDVVNPVCYLNLRNQNVVTGWIDELHPDRDSMRRIATMFVEKIDDCLEVGA